MRHPVRQRCAVVLRGGASCGRPVGHSGRHQQYFRHGVYRVDAHQVPRQERPRCWSQGGCCLHPGTRQFALQIAAEKGSVTVAEVASAQGTGYATASAALCFLLRTGKLARTGRGRYALPDAAGKVAR